MIKKKTHNVFGISNEILDDSYIDRGSLDSELKRLLDRRTHIAIRGPSKSGKSWLRQRVIKNSITVQCRLGFTSTDIYTQALAEIGTTSKTSEKKQITLSASGEVSGEAGLSIAKATAKAGANISSQREITEQSFGNNINDLKFVANSITESKRRLVIEDLHYLSSDQRHILAHELKTLWDYGCFVILVGVWGQANLLVHCNPDLSGRLEELSIEWTPDDLRSIFEKGGRALNIHISRDIQNKAIVDCFGNSGLLQKLILRLLDEAGIEEEQETELVVSNLSFYESSAMAVADQLNGVYQKFAERVANGIRKRSEATGIYAHAMAAIMEAEDRKHLLGITLTEIFNRSHARQPRIQKPNLKSILTKIDGLQVDENGRGLVVTYDESEEKVLNVDRQLLFYRKYVTLFWPWEELIKESEERVQAERRKGGQIDLFSE
ncbi:MULTISPECIES: hypothetical protein [unclassified Pseudomonas]|nr:MULTISPECIES: hypothetical protein [unclassified Pseudomonas]NTX93120.1 hypothetical protein [Pseudomonas sp. UMA643]NTY21108.1 hypothetical protein [Pseudomonas sp. UMC3103]NTY27616.1 hypothetical protein [Pseudomonas sp. UMA603]NTY34165.1 hypothetical protein [Pseudomonas sp. UMC3129]NTY57347.1 hypothetical protein [Pseudomonas sp. UMC631]